MDKHTSRYANANEHYFESIDTEEKAYFCK